MEFLLNFPVETEEAQRFWASKHRLNRVKAIIAFSTDLDNANDNLRRHGYKSIYRHKMLNFYKCYVNQPKMNSIPFSGLDEYWYNPVQCTSSGSVITSAPVALIPDSQYTSQVTKYSNGLQIVTMTVGNNLTGHMDRLKPNGDPNGNMGYGSTVTKGDSNIATLFITGRDVIITGVNVGETSFTVISGDGSASVDLTVRIKDNG
ncbi:TPA: hypothetical protein PCJ90_001350 [Klebsiella quasipneumoniae]|nr:hypothetical protein [Klebsiella quasipneumoniae]